MMRTSPFVMVALMLSAPVATATAQRQQGHSSRATLQYAAAQKLAYSAVGPGLTTASVWGDANTGPYSVFTRFAPKFDAGMHTHTNDVTIVVLKGAYLYRDEAGQKRVGPGDFLRIPGGHKHWSGGDPVEGAEFYQHGNAKFDLVPAK